MKLLNVNDFIEARKKGQRRSDLFRRENLETWLLYFPPGDVQRMHSHPSDRTYYVVTGRGIMKGLSETHDVSAGMILSIPAHEYYEGSNPTMNRWCCWETARSRPRKIWLKRAGNATRSMRKPASELSTSMAVGVTLVC
jgi:quercetin dioxygenase-like cupin family protein